MSEQGGLCKRLVRVRSCLTADGFLRCSVSCTHRTFQIEVITRPHQYEETFTFPLRSCNMNPRGSHHSGDGSLHRSLYLLNWRHSFFHYSVGWPEESHKGTIEGGCPCHFRLYHKYSAVAEMFV